MENIDELPVSVSPLGSDLPMGKRGESTENTGETRSFVLPL